MADSSTFCFWTGSTNGSISRKSNVDVTGSLLATGSLVVKGTFNINNYNGISATIPLSGSGSYIIVNNGVVVSYHG